MRATERIATMRNVVKEKCRLAQVDALRREANSQLDPVRKSEFGQFMTPMSVARFMASLFSKRDGRVNLLDPGAGIGSLSVAFIEEWGRHNVSVDAYEVDDLLASYLRKVLAEYGNGTYHATVIKRDFIEEAVNRIQFDRSRKFTHAILNPPYRKIRSESRERSLLRTVGLETVNLYTGFLGLAIELMAEVGEIVAIVPRSFCNGLYYKPFREWLLERTAIEHIHLFHSRVSAFNEDDVLQENIIVKLVRDRKQGQVTVTTSSGTDFSDLRKHKYAFSEIVYADDKEKFIHVPVDPMHGGLNDVPLARRSLMEIGIQVSTGPVVDFRVKEFLREKPERGTVPLLYATHFSGGQIEWPRNSKKPNAMVEHAETAKWCYRKGFYTVVRRFSSKEERRRIVAHVVNPKIFKGNAIGFENHLNVFHAKKNGISCDMAYGLSVFLNSTAVDEFFRRFSGHTQVNATDLRLLRYPDVPVLEKLGKWAQGVHSLTQVLIDKKVKELHGQGE